MITHHNAVNTILDINVRYQITEQDTAFGISNLHFDLSVYDVFGILGAGGKLVLSDPEYGKRSGALDSMVESGEYYRMEQRASFL